MKDRRVDRTLKNIRTAFSELVIEKEIEQITIKELAERADINRKTFYMHYPCIEDLIDEIERNIIDRFMEILEHYDFFDSNFDIYRLMNSFSEVINEDLDFYKKLLASSCCRIFLTQLKDKLKEFLITKYRRYILLDEVTLNLYAEYIASGIISMYEEWFSTGTNLSLEEMSNLAGNIILNGISAFLSNDVRTPQKQNMQGQK